MDRQRFDGGQMKARGTTKVKTGEMVGNCQVQTVDEAEKEGHVRTDSGRAMDAVREVVQSEGKHEKIEDRSENGAHKAMDAVREVVEKE